MKRLFAIAMVALCAAAQAVTTDDYVPEGLIAMWDGYENDGAGGHATELTEWKDTSGTYSFVFNASSGITVGGSALVFAGAKECYATLNATGTAATFEAAKNGTMEIVFKAAEDRANKSILIRSSAASGITAGNWNSQTAWVVSSKNSPMPVLDGREGVTTLTLRYTNGTASDPYANGQAISTSGNDYFGGAGSVTTVGADGQNGSPFMGNPFKGEVYAIRLYSTPLTPKQIAENRALDVRRFVEGNFTASPNVRVQGYPQNYATVAGEPQYGLVDCVPGETFSMSVPASFVAADGRALECLGWKLYDRSSGELITESGEQDKLTCEFTYTKKANLVWQWRVVNMLTIRNFDADLATVYVNDQPTTNGQQVAVDGTVKIELGGFRNDYYFRYAPENQTDRELAFDCWEGVPSGYEGANPATFTVDGDLTITPNVNVKGYKWRLSDDRTAVENQYFRWNVTIPAKSTDRTVSLGVFIANLVGSTTPSLPLDCVQRVEVDGKNYTITGVSGSDKTPFFAENSYIDSIVLPWRFTTLGNHLAKGSNFVITNLVGLAEANVTSVGNFVFNSNTTTVFQGPVENFVPMHATSIGSEAYNGRSGMTGEMVLTDVTSIGQQAFRYCSGLTSMRITSPNLKSLGGFTFWNCSALTDITLCATNLTYVDGNCIEGGNKRFTFIGGAPSWAIATKIVQYQTAVDGAHTASFRIDPTESSWWDLTVPPTENELAAGLPEGFLGVFVDNVGARKAWVVADGEVAGATLLETDMTRQDGNTGYVTHGGLKHGDTITLTAPEGMTKCELQHLRDGYWTTETVKTGETVIYTHGGELTRAVWGVDGVTLGVTTKGYKGTYSVEVVDGEELGSGIYSTGAKVRVTAIGSSEHPRSAISSWSGDVPAGQETNATIELTLEENTTVEALFRPLEWLYDPVKKTITDGEYTSKAGDGNTNVDYEYGMYFQGFTAADYTLWLDFSIPIYNPNDPEHDYWLAKVSGNSNNQNWRHVRFGTNITTVAGEMFYYSSTLEDVEGFGKTRVVDIPANFFRAIGLNKQTRDASEFVPETLTNINTYSYLDAPELTGTLRLRITDLDARGSIRVNGCTNFEFLAEGVTNAASFKTVVAPERVLFASTNLVTAAQGAFNKNLKDLVFCAHAPPAAALDNILYSVATTNATVHCSKYAPGWKAMRAAGYSAMDEWTARPDGCWGIYQTADGKKRFYLVQRDSKYDVRTGFSVILKRDMGKGKIWFMAVVAALGGFLFGFDTIVINGAEQDIQRLWSLSGTMHGWVVSSALWGTVAGALAGGWFADRFGRKPTLCAVGFLYFVSALWSALAGGPVALMVARLIGGFGVGISTIAAPVYIAEISPADSRGRLTALFQFNIVTGIVVALASNLALKDVGENAWRWMLGAECAPAFLFLALAPFLEESPRWLAQAGLGQRSRSTAESSDSFWSRANLRPILLAFFVAFFNQMSGCNAINYFAPRIFQMAGLGRDSAFLSTFGLGFLQAGATFAGLWLIDRIGRRTLLIVGGIGYVVSLFAAAAFFAAGNGPWAAATIFVFLASHGLGQGTVIWVLISEVFPQRFRAEGQALGASTHWVFAALVALVFPIAAESVPAWSIFAFFGVMMVAHLLWAWFIVPETKGRSLEDIA